MDVGEKLASLWEEALREYQHECFNLLTLFTTALNDWVNAALAQMPAEWRANWDHFVQDWQAQGVELQDAWKEQFKAWMAEHERKALNARSHRTFALAWPSDRSGSRASVPTRRDSGRPSVLAPTTSANTEIIIDRDAVRRDLSELSRLIDLLIDLRRANPLVYVDYDALADSIVPAEERKPPKDRAQWSAYLAKQHFLGELAALKQWQLADSKKAHDEALAEKFRYIATHKPDLPPKVATSEDATSTTVAPVPQPVWTSEEAASTLKVSPEWDGNDYYWAFTNTRGATTRIQIGTFKDGAIYVIPEFGGYLLESNWWTKDGETTLRVQLIMFKRDVLSAAQSPLTSDELRLLVRVYLRNGGWARLEKAAREAQEKLDRIGYLTAAPGTPEYTEYRRKLSARESDRYVAYMEEQGYSPELAHLALFLLPASVNPSGANLDNVATILSGFAGLPGSRASEPSAQGTPNTPPRSSPLPESYIDTTRVIDMTRAPVKSEVNAAGFARNYVWFWNEMLKTHPELFSDVNRNRIQEQLAPIVDDVWIKANPTHASFKGDKLIHHHIDQGPNASGLPETLHRKWHGTIHPKR